MTYPLLELCFQPDEGRAPSDNSYGSRPHSGRRDEASGRTADDPSDEVTLAERIRGGDSAALGMLYERTFRDLWVFARRYVGDDRAEETVQDVFLAFWTRREWTITTTVRAYLFGAVRHRALNALHRSAIEARFAEVMLRDAQHEREAHDVDDMTAADERELRQRLMRAIVTFPERQRAAIVLRVERDLSYSEIGDVLGISATAAGNLVKKAEDKLRRLLEDWRPLDRP